jgi:mycothiol synthase
MEPIELLSEPRQMALALATLVADLARDEQAVHLQAFSQLLTTAPERLVVCRARGDESSGVAAAQILPGRTAMIYPSRPPLTPLAEDLILRTVMESKARGALLAQALLPPEASADRNLLLQAGFQVAGTIVYMAADADQASGGSLSGTLEFETVEPDDPRLAKAIEQSYQGSLDCPLVDGWRVVADVVEGYQSVGRYEPGLWQLAVSKGEVVGCLLLAAHPDDGHIEVVYLGILPVHRGRSFGRVLVIQAAKTARKRGFSRLVLAVDASNWPARKLYAGMGFGDIASREVMVRRL